MSSTNKTATIELSQYIATDKPTYLVDYNGDMRKIDEAIASDREGISAAQSTADTADGKADANAAAISALDTEINDETDGIVPKVNDLAGDVNTIQSLIGNGTPTTTDKTIIGAINELKEDIDDVDTLIGSGTPSTTDKTIVGAINELKNDVDGIHLGELLKYTASTSETTIAEQISTMYNSYAALSNSEKIHSYIKRGSYIYRCTSHGNTGMFVTNIEDNGDIRTEMIVLSEQSVDCKMLRYVVNTSSTVAFTDVSTQAPYSELELYVSHVS